MKRDYFYILLGIVGVSAVLFTYFFLTGIRGIHVITAQQQESTDLFMKNVQFYKYQCYGDYRLDDPLLQIMQYPDFGIDQEYVPENLVFLASAYVLGGRQVQVREDIKAPTEAFIAAARAAGHQVAANSGYRTFAQQRQLAALPEGDLDHPKTAIPGFSEHHLGTAVDISVPGGYGAAAISAGYAWLAEHAHEYGFVLSYPKGKEEKTGFRHEPWHFRYVGTTNAQRFVEEDVLLSELSNAFLLNTDDSALYPHSFSSQPVYVGVLRGSELRTLLEHDFLEKILSEGHLTGIIAKAQSRESFMYPGAEGATIAVSVTADQFAYEGKLLDHISAQTIINDNPVIIELVKVDTIDGYLVVSYKNHINQSRTVIPYLLGVCN